MIILIVAYVVISVIIAIYWLTHDNNREDFVAVIFGMFATGIFLAYFSKKILVDTKYATKILELSNVKSKYYVSDLDLLLDSKLVFLTPEAQQQLDKAREFKTLSKDLKAIYLTYARELRDIELDKTRRENIELAISEAEKKVGIKK